MWLGHQWCSLVALFFRVLFLCFDLCAMLCGVGGFEDERDVKSCSMAKKVRA